MTDYLLYQVDDADGRPVHASGSRGDQCAVLKIENSVAQSSAEYRYMRERLAELKQTHGCGDRPEIEAFNG